MSRRLIGYLMLIVTGVAASVFASRIPIWTGPFSVSMVAMGFSLWLARRGGSSTAVRRDGSTAAAGTIYDFGSAAARVAGSLAVLCERGEIPPAEIRISLDSLINGDVFDFATAREQLLERHGYGLFARVMCEFSSAERWLNRAWSAAVDNYPAEVRQSLLSARDEFGELNRTLKKLKSGGAEKVEAER